MANPESDSLIKPHFFQPLLPGFHDRLNIPERFFKKHIEGKSKNKTAELISDVSHRTWEVKMEGRRFTGGWKEFAVEHDYRIGDIIVFRHEGGLVFHVTGFGPSCCNLQYSPSPPSDDQHKKTRNVSRNKKKVNKNLKTETKSSTDYTCLEVTASNLRLDRRFIPTGFAVSNDLNNRWCDIVLMNEHGSSWTLDLRYRKTCGMVYISRGWRRFCRANGLQPGSLCKFKMVRNGTEPVLQLCPAESSNKSVSQEERSEANKRSSKKCSKRKEETTKTLPTLKASSASGKNRFVIIQFTPYVHRTGQLRLPTSFTRLNGIKESGDITLLDKNGVEWPSYLRLVTGRRWFYMSKGCREFCEANGVKKGESFVLELIWEDTTPILKFCSETQKEQIRHDNDNENESESAEHEENQQETMTEAKAQKRRTPETVEAPIAAEESQTETEDKTHKRVRVRGPILDPERENRSKHQEERPTDSTPTRRATLEAESSRGAQSEPVAKAKERIGDALTTLRQFRGVLVTKEQDLEASLLELGALGK